MRFMKGKKLTALLSAGLMLLSQGVTFPVGSTAASAAADDTQDDWLHVEGDKIVDMNGNEVWLTPYGPRKTG